MAKKPKSKFTKRQAQNAQKAAKAKAKELRPYMRKMRDIDLRKPLTAQQMNYISRAFTEYQELTTRPVKVFRTKNKKHLAKAQAYSRHEKGAPKFDVAFVPVSDPKARLIFKGDSLKIRTRYVTESVLFFDLEKLAKDAPKEIARTLANNSDADQFIIMAGKYLYNGGLEKQFVESRVSRLMLKYADPDQNNFWGNWLLGVIATEYHNQNDFHEYLEAYRKQVEAVKRQKAAIRRNWRKTYGRKIND